MQILKVTDEAFRPYGKVITGIDVSDIIRAMEKTPCPKDDVVYVASEADLEVCGSAKQISDSLVRRNADPDWLLQRKQLSSECSGISPRQRDQRSGDRYDPDPGKGAGYHTEQTYDSSKMEAFLVPAGTVIEVYATTLHYAPCNVAESGFKAVVVLPKGTNTDLDPYTKATKEDEMLFARNKWLLSHPEANIEGSVAGIQERT